MDEDSDFIPQLTITGSNGEQVPVMLFPMPLHESRIVPPWEFFPAPELEPEPETTFADLAAAEARAEQEVEDRFYRHLSTELFSEYKEMRVPAETFRAHCCRICGEEMSPTSLARHLGIWTGGREDPRLLCPAAPNLVEGAEVSWVPNLVAAEVEDEEDEEDEDEGAQSPIYWDFS
ncbi:hypothetical protein LB507_008640 [Fusarium sp. FIESC RH6]|nr:hypothetical protein LB507_008640 [Fusarium sp. FIESC RH6]